MIVKLHWRPKKSTETPFVWMCQTSLPRLSSSKRTERDFLKSGGWGYALFNYQASSDKYTADPSSSDCGHSCHMAVKAKEYIFHPYQKR
jgi:hypothetical protein